MNLKPKTLNLNQLLKLAISAAESASHEILEVYHSENFETQLKSDNSPLTQADKRAHLCIERHLKKTGIPILSEEGKNIPYEERKNWKRFWMVDPLDGTKEFIKRNDEFTVNIALIENQQPILGVLAVPVTGVMYYAAKGLGTFKLKSSKFNVQSWGTSKPETWNEKLETKNHEPESLILKQETSNQKLTRVVASRSHMNDETKDFIAKLGNTEVVAAGSSLKFMLLAEGKADIYPRFGPTMEWDTAAAHGILKELGIKVMTTDGKSELTYNKPNLLNPYFIAG